MSTAVLRRGYVDTPRGQIHYVECGRGRPILLLHQTPRSWDEFRELLPLLGANRRAIAIDMPGFGASYSIPAPQTIEQIADGTIAFADALGLDTFDLLGHHTGGAAAIEIAARVPTRVGAVVLSSAPWTDADYRAAHAHGVGVDEAETATDGSHLTTLWGQRQPYYPTGRPDLLDRFIRDALADGVNPVEGHLACARYVMDERIGAITAPTLLIGAADDVFALPDVARLRAHLTGAATVTETVIPGGMIPLIEQKTTEVAAAVEDFLTHLTNPEGR